MSEQPESPTPGEDPELGAVPPPPPPPPPPVAEPATDWSSPGPDAGAVAAASDRPEVAVGAAFAGGLVLALVLKRLAR